MPRRELRNSDYLELIAEQIHIAVDICASGEVRATSERSVYQLTELIAVKVEEDVSHLTGIVRCISKADEHILAVDVI